MRKEARDAYRQYMADHGYFMPPETGLDVVTAWGNTITVGIFKLAIWGVVAWVGLGLLGGFWWVAVLAGVVVLFVMPWPSPDPPATPTPFGDARPATSQEVRNLDILR